MVDTKEAVKKIAKGTIKNPLEGKTNLTGVKLTEDPLHKKAKMYGKPESKSSTTIKKILGK